MLLSLAMHPVFLNFLDKEEEKNFRLSTFEKDKKATKFIFIFPVSLLSIIFSINDFKFLTQESYALDFVIFFRFIVLIHGLYLILAIRTMKDPFLFDTHLVIWCFFAAALSAFVTWTRPAEHLFLPLLDFSFLLFMGALAPNRFLYSVPVVIFCILSSISTAFRVGQGSNLLFLLGLYASSTFFGLSVAFFTKRQERLLYSHAEEEKRLRQSLQAAAEEIKNLKEMIPICMHCRSVRDDQGYWQGIERYLRKHKGLAFSHGLCPTCLVEHYSEEMESDPLLASAYVEIAEQKKRKEQSFGHLETLKTRLKI